MPSPEFFVDLARQLDAAPHGHKEGVIKNAIPVVGSRSKVYRGLRENGWVSGRGTRSDHGKCAVPDEQLQAVANYLWSANRANGKQILFTPQAMDDLRANGILTVEVSAATLQRALRARGIAPKQLALPKPVQRMRSLHPNHVHQIDPSVCVMFYFGRRMHWKSPSEYYKNKPDNEEQMRDNMLWRYVLTDHASGLIQVHYQRAAGESFQTFFQALVHFWGAPEGDAGIFHGVPKILISDNVGAMKTAEMQTFLSGLSVEHITHSVGSPRVKGQVEGANNIVETHFENRLDKIRIRDITHLNALAAKWAHHFNSTQKHRRHGMTRAAAWSAISSDQLRLLPDLDTCRLLAEPRAQSRKVTPELTVLFQNRAYSLRGMHGINVGDPVDVRPDAFTPEAIFVTHRGVDGTESKYQLLPIRTDHYGQPEDAPVIGEKHPQVMPDTPRDVALKAMAKNAHGAETLREVDQQRKKGIAPFGGQVDPMHHIDATVLPDFLQRPGKPAIPARPASPRVPHVEAFGKIADQLGRALTGAEGAVIRQEFPEGCSGEEITRLVERFQQPLLQAV